MPKKTASARGGASRNRPKAQKSVQLVRPNAAAVENETQQDESSVSVEEETTLAAPTAKATAASTATVSKKEAATGKKSEEESATSQAQKAVEETTTTTDRGSAAARLAARRQGQAQAALKPAAPRNASLITAEHYAYVKRDLIYILILAIIMFSVIITLHFVPAIGG
jgi:hypothetical protein